MRRIMSWWLAIIFASVFGGIVAVAQTPSVPRGQAPIVVAQSQAPLRAPVAQPRPLSFQQMEQRANENTLSIISGNPNGTYLFIAYDMSVVLNDSDNLRVLPVIGQAGYQNVKDLLFLKGIDLGITQSNIMTYLKDTKEMGNDIENRLSYIAKLYNEEMHILAGPGIESIADLNGKKCNYSDVGSGGQFSTRRVFGLLGIKCEEVNLSQGDGYLKVKSGEIAATIQFAGKPTGAFARFKLEPGMKLLGVPYTKELESDYFPATFTAKDYSNLVPEGNSVETVAVGAVLAVYNWPRDSDRYRRVAKFTDAFFSKFDEFLKPPRHSKWQETNYSAPLRGWKRFPAAQEWLDRNQKVAAPPKTTGVADCRGAEAHWKSAETLNILAGFEDHLARFPNCTFSTLARAKIQALKK